MPGLFYRYSRSSSFFPSILDRALFHISRIAVETLYLADAAALAMAPPSSLRLWTHPPLCPLARTAQRAAHLIRQTLWCTEHHPSPSTPFPGPRVRVRYPKSPPARACRRQGVRGAHRFGNATRYAVAGCALANQCDPLPNPFRGAGARQSAREEARGPGLGGAINHKKWCRT